MPPTTRGPQLLEQCFSQGDHPSQIQTLLEVELTPPAPGRVLANQSLAPPTEMGSGVPLRSRQSPRGATWGLGGTVQRQRVSFLLDFTLGGWGLNCWCQLTTMWRLKPEQRSEAGSRDSHPRTLSPWIHLYLQLSGVHKSVNVCFA